MNTRPGRRQLLRGVAGFAASRIGLAALAGCGILPQEARRGARAYRIGYLTSGGPPSQASDALLDAFRDGMRDHGYVEGENFAVEARYGAGKAERLPELAAELVRLNVDIILTGPSSAAEAAKKATSGVPIVMVTPFDAVAAGLISSLGRPGGNVTGQTLRGVEAAPKRLELLREVVPQLRRLAYITSVAPPVTDIYRRGMEAIASSQGIELQLWEVREPTDVDAAFAAMARDRPDALFVIESPALGAQIPRIAQLAIQHRLPTVAGLSEWADFGYLIGYGPNIRDMYRRAARYVDKLLKGAKPGDLPVEQPAVFELAINLKTAQALGVTVPESLLARAQKVIR